MVETIALKYIASNSNVSIFIGFCFVAMGGCVAAWLDRGKTEMRRVPFFVFSSIVVFGLVAIRIVWLQISAAILGGYAWAIVAVHLSALFLVGFCNGRIALARARDAYGDRWYAVLAFIPLANLALVFKRSLTPDSAKKIATIKPFRGMGGVLVGILIFVAGFLVSGWIKWAFEQQEGLQKTDVGALQRQVEVSLRLHGLEGTLRNIASGTPMPAKVDKTMTVIGLVADGTRLHRTIMLDASVVDPANLKGISADALAMITQDLGREIVQAVCSAPLNAPLLQAGASMDEFYVGSDGTPIVSRTVTREVCGL
ncbi:MAG: hypothetical protein JF625_15295 [Inquilinus limosus]|uniref:Uncharacterized protein n=1 Tax=Inquilinus limosus TaxID=171674 RepID=A0A952FNQ5_9PROT|nr:hypothetical protein [Inquilinus limosus]